MNSRERCFATRAGTLPRPARCPIRGQPGAFGTARELVTAATPACRDNGGRPMGAGVARRWPGRNRRRRRRRTDSHGRPRKHGALRARPGAGADWRLRRCGRRCGRRRRIVGGRGGCPIAAHARAGARLRARRRVRRLHCAVAGTVDACRAGGKGRARRRRPRRPRDWRGGRTRLWPDHRAPERRHGGAARTPASADRRR